MRTVHLLIAGHVQGVGFRYFALERARRLGLTGRARNLPDGTVEVEAEGEPEGLEEFVRALRRGPPAARVAQVAESWSEGPARHQGFDITA